MARTKNLMRTQKKAKKLVGVIHALNQGGAERNMVNILNYMTNEGINVELIIFQAHGVFLNQLDKRIIIHDLNSSSVKNGIIKLLLKLYKIKPNIVFTGIEHVNILLSIFIPFIKLYLPNTRWISRETNIVSIHKEKNDYPKIFHLLYRYTYHNFDAIIAQSEDMKKDLLKYYPKSAAKTVVINNPINIKRIQTLAKEEINFPFSKNSINLISVAALRNQKRHDLLLKTFALLPKNYRLIIIGGGNEEKDLKRLASTLCIEKRIVFLGLLRNPYPYMAKSNLLILTSEHEGFPNVLLEANSLGMPIVSFNCLGGISDIILQGENGFHVPFPRIELLASKILEATDSDWDKEKIIQLTKARYSEEKIYKFYKKILNL